MTAREYAEERARIDRAIEDARREREEWKANGCPGRCLCGNPECRNSACARPITMADIRRMNALDDAHVRRRRRWR